MNLNVTWSVTQRPQERCKLHQENKQTDPKPSLQNKSCLLETVTSGSVSSSLLGQPSDVPSTGTLQGQHFWDKRNLPTCPYVFRLLGSVSCPFSSPDC